MKSLAAAAIAIVVGVSGAASASDRLSDAEYIALSRCAGFAAGLDQDADAWRAQLRTAERGRSALAQSHARTAHDNARRSVNRANERGKADIRSDFEQTCAAWAPTA